MKFISSILCFVLLCACGGNLSEEEYYKNAKDNYSKQEFELAVDNFKSLIEKYPNSSHSSEAVFMLGFINANDLRDLDEAKKYYEQFIEKYPDHELYSSARYELDNLGMDINELPIFKELDADSTKEISSKK